MQKWEKAKDLGGFFWLTIIYCEPIIAFCLRIKFKIAILSSLFGWKNKTIDEVNLHVIIDKKKIFF